MSHKVLNDSDADELRKQFLSIDAEMGSHFQQEYLYRVDRLEAVVNGDGKTNHPWGPHTKSEEPSHLIPRLEEMLNV